MGWFIVHLFGYIWPFFLEIMSFFYKLVLRRRPPTKNENIIHHSSWKIPRKIFNPSTLSTSSAHDPKKLLNLNFSYQKPINTTGLQAYLLPPILKPDPIPIPQNRRLPVPPKNHKSIPEEKKNNNRHHTVKPNDPLQPRKRKCLSPRTRRSLLPRDDALAQPAAEKKKKNPKKRHRHTAWSAKYLARGPPRNGIIPPGAPVIDIIGGDFFALLASIRGSHVKVRDPTPRYADIVRVSRGRRSYRAGSRVYIRDSGSRGGSCTCGSALPSRVEFLGDRRDASGA